MIRTNATLIIILFLFSNNAFGKRGKLLSVKEHAEEKLWYLGYERLKKVTQSQKKINLKYARLIISNISSSYFKYDNDLDTLKDRRNIYSFPKAMRYMFKSNFIQAEIYLKKVKKSNYWFANSQYFLALINSLQGDYKSSNKHASLCVKNTKRLRGDSGEKLKNRCYHLLGRNLFSIKEFKKSLRALEKVQLEDLLWPRTLVDKAWSFYWLNNQMFGLGTLLAYEAPLMSKIVHPESYYLRGLMYYEMCYLDKFYKIEKDFTENVLKHEKFVERLNDQKILYLATEANKGISPHYDFSRDVLIRYSKDSRYKEYLKFNKSIQRELQYLVKQFGKRAKTTKAFRKISAKREVMERDIIRYFKNVLYDFSDQIDEIKQHFIKLKLAVGLEKRKEFRNRKISKKEKESIVNRSIADLNVDKRNMVFDFIGGFWTDELDSYALAIRTRCKK